MSQTDSDCFTYLHNQLDKAALADGYIYGVYLGLAFGFVEADEVISAVWERTGIVLRFKQVHASIRTNGKLLWDAKHYAYAHAALMLPKFAPLVTSSVRATELDIPTRNIIKKALLGCKAHLFNPLRTALKAGLPPLSMRDMRQQIEETVGSEELTTYNAKFIFRKMSFLLRAGTRDFDGLMTDLREQATYGLLRTYPAWSDNPDHRIALAKSNSHNRGQNIIKEQTAQSRAPLQGNQKSGYTATQVSLDAFGTTIASGDALNMLSQVHATFDGAASTLPRLDWDTEVSLLQLVDNQRMPERQRLYLKLLLGHHHDSFSTWIGSNNAELAHSMPFERYDAKVREYLNIPAQAATTFLRGLQKAL